MVEDGINYLIQSGGDILGRIYVEYIFYGGSQLEDHSHRCYCLDNRFW